MSSSVVDTAVRLTLASGEYFYYHIGTIIFLIWFFVEIGFYIYLAYFIYPELNILRKSPQHEMDPRENMIRGLESLNKIKHVYSFEKFFTGWFKGCKIEDIKEGNVEAFLAWTTYQRSLEELSPNERLEIQEVIKYLSTYFNISFPKGFNKDIRFIMMTHEAVMFNHKPFIFYALVMFFNWASSIVFRWYGYERYAVSDMDGGHYWYRPDPLKSHDMPNFRPTRARSSFYGFSFLGNSPEKQKKGTIGHMNNNNRIQGSPISSSTFKTEDSSMPIHPPNANNIGFSNLDDNDLLPKLNIKNKTAPEDNIGVFSPAQNTNKTKEDKSAAINNYPLIFFHGISPGLFCYLPFLMNMCKDRASIFIEIPHVTTTLNFTPHQHSIMVYAVEHILDRHHIKEAAVMGHSFGSICAKVIACSNENIKQLILVDPVCLLLVLPDVAFNFLYWEPLSKFAKYVYHHLGLRGEITISNALRRHFWWYENILWLEDLPCDLIVALPEFDGIIPVDAIKAYLESYKTKSSSEASKRPMLESRRSLSLSIDELPVYQNDIRCILWKNYFHGRVLFEENGQQELLDEMRAQQILIADREKNQELQGNLDDSLSRRRSLCRSNSIYKRPSSYSRNISFF